jgi:hypothetical protein
MEACDLLAMIQIFITNCVTLSVAIPLDNPYRNENYCYLNYSVTRKEQCPQTVKELVAARLMKVSRDVMNSESMPCGYKP